MRPIIPSAFGLLLALSIPADARDLTYTVRKGQTISFGPWYYMDRTTCRMIGVPKVTVVKPPKHGSIATSTSQAKPGRPEQIAACPNLVLTHINAIYTAREAGTDNVSFLVEYSPPLAGDWLYNISVQVVDVDK
jgi:hypothetical protein